MDFAEGINLGNEIAVESANTVFDDETMGDINWVK